MKKVMLFVEEMDKDGEVTFATLFVGVMDDEFIYVKRVSVSCETDPEFIKVSVKDTKDCSSACVGIKENFAARDMQVSENDALEDSRIIKEPDMSEEIKELILDAITMYDKE